MAAPPGGFPWQAPARDPEKVSPPLEEALTVANADHNNHSDHLASPTKSTASSQWPQPRKHHSIHGKRRHGSNKGPPRVLAPASNPPSDPSASKASSPLPVRTIPPWVRDAEEEDLEDPQFHAPDHPHSALVAHHHYDESNARRPPISGRQPHEHGGHVPPERNSRWLTFARPSAYPRENFNSEKVDQSWIDTHFTDYSKPWLAGHEDDDDEDSSDRYRAFRRKRQVWYKRAQFTILRNPFIPLAFRLTILLFAAAALGLGASIYHETGRILACVREEPSVRTQECIDFVGPSATDYYRDPSGLMAVIVDAIAIIYTMYITYDEYFSKPLGLRPARAKIRLVLLDMFFVVFQSANLSLSFESLTVDEGACKVGTNPQTVSRFGNVCDRVEALSGVLLVSLVAWLMTFSISVLRLVERIDTK